jgi:hypothetical protein
MLFSGETSCPMPHRRTRGLRQTGGEWSAAAVVLATRPERDRKLIRSSLRRRLVDLIQYIDIVIVYLPFPYAN